MFADPFAARFAKHVCSRDKDSKWSFENLRQNVQCIFGSLGVAQVDLNRSSGTISSTTTSLNDSSNSTETKMKTAAFTNLSDDDESDCSLGFFDDFHKQNRPSIGKDFDSIIKKFSEYNPIEFWSQSYNQTKYPEMFRINQLTLSYASTSVFQETVFSTAGRTLTSCRGRLSENPDLQETVTLMAHILRSRRKREQVVKKEEKRKEKSS